jgi:hypothetical protein
MPVGEVSRQFSLRDTSQNLKRSPVVKRRDGLETDANKEELRIAISLKEPTALIFKQSVG